ncbi:tRNA (cytidine(34)-2'-O)-methyltransferase [Marinobacterium sp. YM272]|uniref:tRNA (cytidine(34)-2'-O)-methyltransferase n=1 Tax=Marinobacterium sp. YM272 TaxID=3421654 RepID=UPI003D7F584F
MLNVVLYQPEIPPNTGNIIRLCANTGFHLHLIEPLGFELDDKRLRRAGLDYREYADVKTWPTLEACVEALAPSRVWAMTTKTERCYTDATFSAGDILLLGPETRGLPESVRQQYDALTLPMLEGSRSMNLSNACAVIVFEAWRQLGFAGSAGQGRSC